MGQVLISISTPDPWKTQRRNHWASPYAFNSVSQWGANTKKYASERHRVRIEFHQVLGLIAFIIGIDSIVIRAVVRCLLRCLLKFGFFIVVGAVVDVGLGALIVFGVWIGYSYPAQKGKSRTWTNSPKRGFLLMEQYIPRYVTYMRRAAVNIEAPQH
ncbi:hypothetical protein V8F33_001764 [Rhypophila sp. PSN 637]